MKNVFAIYTNGNKTSVEETSCSVTKTKISSFKFSISVSNIDKIILDKESGEFCAFTFDKDKVTLLRRKLRTEKKKSFKPSLSE